MNAEQFRLLGVIADTIEDGTLFKSGFISNAKLSAIVKDAISEVTELKNIRSVHGRDDWHEDDGDVLWWVLPVTEPPFIGSPLDDNFPGYHTHWTRCPMPII